MENDEAVYQAVAARRLQWDNLLWQVPVLSLTAQAFLFSISLGSGTSRLARGIAATLSVVSSLLSIHLMARHRQAEISDAHWLEMYEKEHYQNSVVHGPTFRRHRNSTRAGGLLARVPAFRVWTVGLSLFGLAALFVLVLTLTGSSWLG